MIDKDEYLRSIKEKMRSEKQEAERGLAAFMSAGNSAEIKAALKRVSSLREPAAVERAIEIVTKKQEEPEVRLLALAKGISGIGKDSERIRACMLIVSDPLEPIEMRRGVLSSLRAMQFGARGFIPLRPEFMTLLRSLLDESDETLREMAAEELAKEKDEYVQRRLLEGLTDREAPIVGTARAIQLLGYDIHAEHYPVVRSILSDPASDETIKLEAIHVLGGDVEARDLLQGLMTDKSQQAEIRMSSAVALKTSDFGRFVSVAKPLILDDDEYDDVRLVSLNAMLLHPDTDQVLDDRDFVTQVEASESLKRSRDLNDLKTKLLDRAPKQSKEK